MKYRKHRIAWLILCLFLNIIAILPEPAAAVEPQMIGNLSIGSIVSIKENGVPVRYIVVNQGKPSNTYDDSCDGTWLLRERALPNAFWGSAGIGFTPQYPSSLIYTQMSTFHERFDVNIQKVVKQVTLPLASGPFSCKTFILSCSEVSNDSVYSNEGHILTYFSNGGALQASDDNGKVIGWYTRTTYNERYGFITFITKDGVLGSNSAENIQNNGENVGPRPALIVPKSLLVAADGGLTSDTPPSAPSNIGTPSTIYGSVPFNVSWGASTDAENNLAGYKVERSVDGGVTWTPIFQGDALSVSDSVPVGTISVLYRVKAYDALGATSGYTSMPSPVSVINNANYTTKYYQQNQNDDGYSFVEQAVSQGTIGTVATASVKEYSHFHENMAAPEYVPSGTIVYDGSLVLAVYYDWNTANITYSYSGKIPTKAPAAPATVVGRYGKTIQVSQAPTLKGYDFSGWGTSDVSISDNSFTMPDAAVTLTGNWLPHTNTPYKVEYFQQHIDDDGYSLAESVPCVGTTDTMATAPERKYTGFTMTPESVTASTSTNIDGDGTTVLKLYYDRNVNTITYSYSGDTDETVPTLPKTSSYRFGQTVTLASPPTLTGYDFSGWVPSETTLTGSSFIMPDAPVTVTGTWAPRADTPYTVEYYQQDISDNNYTEVGADTMAGTGTTGMPITGADKTYPGFTITASSAADLANIKIHSTGDTVLKLYYDRNSYTLIYQYAGKTDTTPPALPAASQHRYGEMIHIPVTMSLTGYDFDGWATADATINQGIFIMPYKDTTVTGSWVPRSDTAFVVEYYQQNLEDHDYTKMNADTYTGEGTTGAPIPQAHKEYEGFTETGPSVAAETATKISSNGSTVLKLYYDRNSYAVTYSYTSEHIDGEPACPAEQHYQFGASVTVEPAPSELTGYHLDGWNSDDVSLSSGAFTMPAKGMSITGAWLPNSDTPYKVEFYQQNLENSEYSLADTVNGHGTTGTAIPEAEKPFTGFTMTAASKAEAETAVIAPDGSTVLKLYYDRNQYTVTYTYSGSIPSDAPTLPATGTYKFGEAVTLTTVPIAKGNKQFSGWEASNVTLAPTFSMPDNDVTITGTWFNLFPDDSGAGAYLATLVSDDTTQEKLAPNQNNEITLPEGRTKDGYTFEGWAESDGGLAEHQAGETITLTKSITFYAVYSKKVEAFIYGYQDGTFRPENNLTTHESQLMLARLMGTPEPDAATNTKEAISRKDFLTAVAKSTATTLVNNDVMETAIKKGWILGYADGTMMENSYITRAQAVIILDRAFNRSDAQPDNAISYTDVPKDYWAYDQIVAASLTSITTNHK